MIQVDFIIQEDQVIRKEIKLHTRRLCYTRGLIVIRRDFAEIVDIKP